MTCHAHVSRMQDMFYPIATLGGRCRGLCAPRLHSGPPLPACAALLRRDRRAGVRPWHGQRRRQRQCIRLGGFREIELNIFSNSPVKVLCLDSFLLERRSFFLPTTCAISFMESNGLLWPNLLGCCVRILGGSTSPLHALERDGRSCIRRRWPRRASSCRRHQ